MWSLNAVVSAHAVVEWMDTSSLKHITQGLTFYTQMYVHTSTLKSVMQH